MTISSVSSNNYYYDTTSTTLAGARRRSSSDSNPMEKALNSLTCALKSGDISTAQSVLRDILSHAPKSSCSSAGSGDSISSSSGGDKITEFLKSLQTALSAGDTTKAQSIVSSLKDYMAANLPPKPPGAAADTTSGTSGSSNPMEKALDSLASALGSGDISTAQSVLKDILSHAPKSSSSSAASGGSINSSSGGDEITDFLKALQTALSSGDTTKAQSIVSSLKDFMAANPPPQPPGAGRYSTDGSLTSISSTSTSALSALA
jgi:hypothetical protein